MDELRAVAPMPQTGSGRTISTAKSVYLPAAVAALGGLLFGYDTAVINGAIVFLKRQFALSAGQAELAASSLLAGCAFGAAAAGFLSDRLGAC